jgi:hypothetical protein
MATSIEVVTRKCRVCYHEWPLDPEHFHRHARQRDGFRMICKGCRGRFRKEERQERYGRAEKSLLLQLAQDIRAGRRHPGHAAILRILSQRLGGARGIAEALHCHYEAAKPGSRQAVAILGAIMTMTTAVEEARRKKNEKNCLAASTMPDAALDENIFDLVKKYLDRRGLEMVPKGSR